MVPVVPYGLCFSSVASSPSFFAHGHNNDHSLDGFSSVGAEITFPKPSHRSEIKHITRTIAIAKPNPARKHTTTYDYSILIYPKFVSIHTNQFPYHRLIFLQILHQYRLVGHRLKLGRLLDLARPQVSKEFNIIAIGRIGS